MITRKGERYNIYVYSCNFRYDVSLTAASYWTSATHIPTGWFHTVINYIGRGEGEGIRIYHDGVLVANDTRKGYGTCQDPICTPDESIVLGRSRARVEGLYCSSQVDELVLFNEPLSEEEIAMLSKHFDNK